MGCTSSAPNMTTTNPNATDTKLETPDVLNHDPIKKDAATMYAEEEDGINEIKVLPTCDTLAEPIQLDSNKSMIITPQSNLEKETHHYVHIESESPPKDNNRIVIEEKLSTVEDVVEKVVELFVADNALSTTEDHLERKEVVNKLTKEIHNKEEDTAHDVQEKQSLTEPNEQEMEAVEGATSPSQSTSSRATRWEALADIAAELPPSLAVDPLTGQIYSLSK